MDWIEERGDAHGGFCTGATDAHEGVALCVGCTGRETGHM